MPQFKAASSRRVNRARKRRLALTSLGLLLVLIVAAAVVGWQLYSAVRAATAEADLARAQLLSGAHVLKTAGLGMSAQETAQAAAARLTCGAGRHASYPLGMVRCIGSRRSPVVGFGLPAANEEARAA